MSSVPVLNRKVKNKKKCIEEYLGIAAQETRNDNGIRIINMCIHKHLITAYTKFGQKVKERIREKRESALKNIQCSFRR